MNDKRKIRLLRVVNIAVWLTLAVFIGLLTLWYWPRETVVVDNFVTEFGEYRVGDEIRVTTDSTTEFSGRSLYDIRLLCDKGRYLLKSFEVATVPREMSMTNSSVGLVPLIPTPDTCVVVTQATHEVQLLPFLTKVYTNEWKTNRFKVEAMKGDHNE